MQQPDDPAVHYDRISEAWRHLLGEDFHYGYYKSPGESLESATENLTALMAESAAIGPDMTVLDVGCGIGNPACRLAKQHGCRVTGISTSEIGVEHARQRAHREGCDDRVSFLVADGMNNGLPDASFDRVWALESSHLMDRKDALLSECARVVRSGGIVVLCDVIAHRVIPLEEVLQRAKDFSCLRYAFGRAKMETLQAYQGWAEDAGLRVTVLKDISEETLPTFTHWRDQLESNRDEVRNLIGDKGLEQFRDSCEILPAYWNQRVLGYGLMAAEKP